MTAQECLDIVSKARATGKRADLGWSCLRGVCLLGADLRGADLRGSDLRRADLRRADLRGADLRGADLRDADLNEADVQGANFRWSDLRGAKGLSLATCEKTGECIAAPSGDEGGETNPTGHA